MKYLILLLFLTGCDWKKESHLEPIKTIELRANWIESMVGDIEKFNELDSRLYEELYKTSVELFPEGEYYICTKDFMCEHSEYTSPPEGMRVVHVNIGKKWTIYEKE